MKKNWTLLLLAGAMALAMNGSVYAATTKTATLNNAQIRFNGGEVQTIQCYNIDGYNYVRARDITNNLDMALYPVLNGETGVMVDPTNQPTSTADPEKLTEKNVTVQLQTGKLTYDGTPSKADCFKLNGRYFFKLADFQKASDNTKDITIEATEFVARAGIATELYSDVFDGIETEWDKSTKVISVNKVETDLRAIFDEIRGTKGEVKAETPKTEEKKEDTSSVDATEENFAEEVLRLVNEEREKAGVDPVELDSGLTDAAQRRAKEIIEVFDHTRPNGENFRSLLDEMGIDRS